MLLLKAYGLAIWEWLFGTGTIFATRDMTNSLVLLQKLCKNCPRPEKLHFWSQDQQWKTYLYIIYIQTTGYNCTHRLIVMRKWEGRLQILIHLNTYEIAKSHAGVQKSLLDIAPMFIFYAKPARLDNMMSLFAFSFIGPEKLAVHNGSKIYLKE